MINVPETIERHLVRRGPHGVDRRLFMSRRARRDRNAQYDLFLAGESINSRPTFTVERENYRPIKFGQSVRPAGFFMDSFINRMSANTSFLARHRFFFRSIRRRSGSRSRIAACLFLRELVGII
jgi:hypothetical protein